MSNGHASRELAIFCGFGESCELPIIQHTIQNREPPEPDILCEVERIGALAFELLEILDENRIARTLGIQNRAMDEFRNGYRAMPDEDQAKMRAGLGNATVRVRISGAVSLNKRREAIREVLESLLNVDAQFEGKYQLPAELGRIVSVTIVRGNFDGPRFPVIAASHYDPIPTAGLMRKFAKGYKCQAPIDLLAYFDSQHAPLDQQIDALREIVIALIASSPFQRVWIYDANSQRNLAVVQRYRMMDSFTPTVGSSDPR